MARYRGPVCRLCRREGKKLFLKGIRCNTDKCVMEHEGVAPPGELKRRRGRRPSGYAIHLREKQRAKRIYGILEHQFRKYYEVAARKKGVTGEILLQLLERRLDNIIYRSGFARSRADARQFVSHGHFLVNNCKTNVASYLIKSGDIVSLKEKSQKLSVMTEILKKEQQSTGWLSVDRSNFKIEVISLPRREDIPLDIREDLIIELYSK